MIAFYERQHPALQANKQIAMAPAGREAATRPEESEREKAPSLAPLTMRAAPSPESPKPAPAPVAVAKVEKKAAPRDMTKSEEKSSERPALAEQPAKRPLLKSAPTYPGSGAAGRGPVAKKGEAGGAAGELAMKTPAGSDSSRTPVAAAPSSTPPLAAPRYRSASPRRLAAGPGVVVVYCDVTAEAARKKAIDKLLDANGIAGRRQRGSINPATPAKGAEAAAAKAKDKAANVADKIARPTTTCGGALAENHVAPDGADVVYCEATPAQIEAAVAGLAAQPDVFLSVSIKPSHDPAALQLARRLERYRRESVSAGASPKESGKEGAVVFGGRKAAGTASVPLVEQRPSSPAGPSHDYVARAKANHSRRPARAVGSSGAAASRPGVGIAVRRPAVGSAAGKAGGPGGAARPLASECFSSCAWSTPRSRRRRTPPTGSPRNECRVCRRLSLPRWQSLFPLS